MLLQCFDLLLITDSFICYCFGLVFHWFYMDYFPVFGRCVLDAHCFVQFLIDV